MRVIACIKQVPDTREVKIDPKTGTLIREGIPSIINPADKNALEEALRIKEKHGGEVIVITMGPPQAEDALREALALGVDRVILVGDRAFAGSDTCATSYTLGRAIQKLGSFDVILCGWEAIDGNTAQVGPQLAELLGLPQATYAQKIDIDGGRAKVQRLLEDGYEVVETQLPLLVTVVKEINEPRHAPFDMILDAYREKNVEFWSVKDIGGEEDEAYGLRGSPTRIRKSSAAEYKKKKVNMLELNEAVQELVEVFGKEQFI